MFTCVVFGLLARLPSDPEGFREAKRTNPYILLLKGRPNTMEEQRKLYPDWIFQAQRIGLALGVGFGFVFVGIGLFGLVSNAWGWLSQ